MTTSTFEDPVLELWDTLYQFGIVEGEVVEGDDVELVKLWINTIRGAGYTFQRLLRLQRTILSCIGRMPRKYTLTPLSAWSSFGHFLIVMLNPMHA